MADSGVWGLRLFLAGAILSIVALTVGALMGAGRMAVQLVRDAGASSIVVPWIGYVWDALVLVSLTLIVIGIALLGTSTPPSEADAGRPSS